MRVSGERQKVIPPTTPTSSHEGGSWDCGGKMGGIH